jgi:hypothetical protein
MNKTLFLLVFLLIIPFSNAYYCYQESANVSNQTGLDTCILNYGGSYSSNNWTKWNNYADMYDGNYNSYADTILFDSYQTVTYVMPGGIILNNSIWQFKDDTGIFNQTLNNCNGSISGNNISLYWWKSASPNAIIWYCLNNSGGANFFHNSSLATKIYEENMYWSRADLNVKINNILVKNKLFKINLLRIIT